MLPRAVLPVCQQKCQGLSPRVGKIPRYCPPYCTCHRVVAKTLFLTQEARYPIVYCILILPLSIVRWINFTAKSASAVPRVPQLIVIFIFSLSGVVNALLYLWTRKRLFQRDERSDPPAPGIKMAQLTN